MEYQQQYLNSNYNEMYCNGAFNQTGHIKSEALSNIPTNLNSTMRTPAIASPSKKIKKPNPLKPDFKQRSYLMNRGPDSTMPAARDSRDPRAP